MLVMVLHVLGENEDEIIIKSHEIIHVLKDIVHKMLKNTRCICKAKQHHNVFKMTITLS
jgi:hypothetical protein